MKGIAEQKVRRFQFLKYLYERTGGSETELVPDDEALQGSGLSKPDFDLVCEYLLNEGLIGGTLDAVCMTHAGMVEIEAALTRPDKPTEHFPVNIIHIEQMHQSQIQQGTVASTQSGTFTSLDLAAVAEFIRGLKDQLPQLGLSRRRRGHGPERHRYHRDSAIVAAAEGGDHQGVPAVDQEYRRGGRGQHGGVRELLRG